MHSTILVAVFEISRTAVAMCSAAIVLLLIGIMAVKNKIAEARGLDKIVTVSNLCFAIPLAVFGALHLFGPEFVMNIVPEYMPWRSFWVFFVGIALFAASVSIAANILVRWSGLLFGIMMFLFVAMIHFPGALSEPHDRFIWTIVFREMSFGGAGWILAGNVLKEGRTKRVLITTGRVFVTLAILLFGIEHFLFATGLPGVPLEKQMPAWIPWPMLIDYVTGAALLAAGGSILLSKKTRLVTTLVGTWILLLVLVIYGPVLISALSAPDTATQVVGINYFADTLFFAGAILVFAKSTPQHDGAVANASLR